MNIETSKVNTRKTTQKNQQTQQQINDSSVKFTDELNVVKNPVKKDETANKVPAEENLTQNIVEPTAQKEVQETEQSNLVSQKTPIETKKENAQIIKETEAINLLKETVESVKAELPEKHIQKNNNALNTDKESLSKLEVNTNTTNKKIKNPVSKNPFIEEKLNKKPVANSQKEANNLTENTNVNNVNSSIKNQPQKPVTDIIQAELNKEPQKEVEIPLQNKPVIEVVQPELNKEPQKEVEIPLQNKPVIEVVQPEINKEPQEEVEIPIQNKPVTEVVQPEINKEPQKEVEIPTGAKPNPKPQVQVELKENLEPITDKKVKKEEVIKPKIKEITTPKETTKTEPVKKADVEENILPKEEQIAPQKKDVLEEDLKPLDNALVGLNTIVKEINKKTILNQSEEKVPKPIKTKENFADEEEKGNDLINNDINIQENKDIMPQMSSNMNFSGDGQPFSSFMNNEGNTEKQNGSILGNSAKDLAEEAAILSTMAENIAIANKNNVLKQQEKPVEKAQTVKVVAKQVVKPAVEPIVKPEIQINKEASKKTNVAKIQGAETKITQETQQDTVEQPQVKTVVREEGIKKVDTKTGITIENVVKYDNIIMNQADVEVFANLVEQGEVDMKNLAPEAAKKAVEVSKSLADMLNKAMESKQPLRIDFDNNISVIIRISRDGKVSAEFLPSSQIAEAYLKENLPMLRQRFDDNNIKYDDLSQRNNSRDREKENNRRKGRNDE